ncbi:NAD(P)/FAD-dependent oxidoreductase [soil metagenome]
MTTIDCDYLVIGAGAAGLAFTDALISEADVDVVLVDRRSSSGGHWNDAYPFVRLHQPSATYGVNSQALGTDTIDRTGANAGFYERATGVEISAYFHDLLERHLMPTGKVLFVPMSDYVGDLQNDHRVVSRLTSAATEVRVRRKVVDATYLETSIPATHGRSFTADPEATVIPVGALASVASMPAGFTILGSGKTAMDACSWLLDSGVDPDHIRWVRPREPWMVDRASVQPLDLLGATIEAFSLSVESLAQAESVHELFARLEACGQLLRLDDRIEPSMFRGPIVSQHELAGLRKIERVVRQGHVAHVRTDQIIMSNGNIQTSRREVHVDCTARGLGAGPPREIFDPSRITIQSLSGGFTTHNAALIAFVEATRDDDAEKNRLCPPVAPPTEAMDWIAFYRSTIYTTALHGAEPDIARFQDESRLSLTRGLSQRLDDHQIYAAVERWMAHADDALRNADRLLAV